MNNKFYENCNPILSRNPQLTENHVDLHGVAVKLQRVAQGVAKSFANVFSKTLLTTLWLCTTLLQNRATNVTTAC